MDSYNFDVQLKFVSPTTGGVRWVGVDHNKRVFSRDYFRHNGGWQPTIPARLKDVRGVVADCIRAGYEEV